MGAWGTGPFDNDEAADWLYELEEAVDGTIVRAALRSVAESVGEVEAPDASVGIAAAEVVAAARGRPSLSLPDSAARWVQANRTSFDDTDRVMAIGAVDRVLGVDSELVGVWFDLPLPRRPSNAKLRHLVKRRRLIGSFVLVGPTR